MTEPDRTLEGYHWGKYTSGSWVKGLWLILLPFGLVNAAAFMVPSPGDAAWLRRLHGLVQAVIRGIGVGVTGTFSLASGLLLVDLVAWQWAAGLPWLTHIKSGYVMTVGVLLAGAAVAALFQLGDENRTSPFGPKPPSSLAATTTTGPTGLLSSSFFRVDSASAPVLGRLHLAFGWCVVALIGALTWEQAVGTSAGGSHAALQHVVYWLALGLLVAIAVAAYGLTACSGGDRGGRAKEILSTDSTPILAAAATPVGDGAPAGSIVATDGQPSKSADPYSTGRHDELPARDQDQRFLREMLNHHESLIYLAHEVMKGQTAGYTKDLLTELDATEDAEKQQVVRLLGSLYSDRHHAVPEAMAMSSVDSVLKAAEPDVGPAVSNFVVRYHQSGIALIDSFMPKLANPKVRALARTMRVKAKKQISVYSVKARR